MHGRFIGGTEITAGTGDSGGKKEEERRKAKGEMGEYDQRCYGSCIRRGATN